MQLPLNFQKFQTILNSPKIIKIFNSISNPIVVNVAFYISLLLLFFFVTALGSYFPSLGLDPSWIFGMEQAVSNKLALGTELIFTFGPYMSLYAQIYSPTLDFQYLVSSSYLYLCFASLFLCLSYLYNKKFVLLLLFLLLFSSSSNYRDSIFYLYIFYTFFCYYQIASQKNIYAIFFVMLTSSGLGLILLIKGSFLGAILPCYLGGLYFFVRKLNIQLFLSSLFAFVFGTIFFWLFSGQEISSLSDWIFSLIPIISGYTQALSVSGKDIDTIIIAVSILFVLLFLLFEIKETPLNKLALLSITFTFCFVVFKAGFARQDRHVMITIYTFLSLYILLTLLLQTARAKKIFYSFTTILLVVYCVSDLIKLPKNIKNTVNHTISMVKERNNDSILKRYNAHLKNLHKVNNLPKLEGTSDIYNYNQTALLVSGNTWNPRPIFQSYSVYTKDLIEKNRQHLLSEKAPDNIFFKVETIDGRFPTLDDGASWPIIFDRYRVKDIYNDYVILQKKDENDFPTEETLAFLEERSTQIGEHITLPKTDKALFAKLHIEPTFLGKLFSTLLKPAQVEIETTLAYGKKDTYRLIPNMVETGFFINPYIGSADDFALLASGSSRYILQNIKSFRIKANKYQWNQNYKIEFFTYENESAVSIKKGLSIPTPVANSFKCIGHIDNISINSDLAQVRGWLVDSRIQKNIPTDTFLITYGNDESEQWTKLERMERPDIVKYFHNTTGFTNSGYHGAALHPSPIKKTAIGMQIGEKFYICE